MRNLLVVVLAALLVSGCYGYGGSGPYGYYDYYPAYYQQRYGGYTVTPYGYVPYRSRYSNAPVGYTRSKPTRYDQRPEVFGIYPSHHY